MQKIVLTFLLAITASLASFGFESHPFYLTYSSSDGLDDSNITGCCQDKFGRLWVGSSDGVFVFTGNKFIPLDNEEYLSTCSRMTLKVYSDGDGCIWIATANGIGFFNPDSGTFTKFQDVGLTKVRDIDVDSQGRVWLTGDGGVFRYTKPSGKMEFIQTLKAIMPTSLCINGDKIIAISQDGSIYSYSDASEKAEPLHLFYIGDDGIAVKYENIVSVDSNQILVSTNTGEIWRMNLASKEESRVLDINFNGKPAVILCMMAKGNEYWLGLPSGLAVYDSLTGKVEYQTGLRRSKWLLCGEYVRDLFTDMDGNVWASTLNGGLKAWINSQGRFDRYVANGSDNSIIGVSITSISQDSRGTIWFGSDTGTLCSLDPKTMQFTDYTSQLGVDEDSVISAVVECGSRLWIGTFGAGIVVMDKESKAVLARYHGDLEFCKALTYTEQGRVYVGTSKGLYYIDNSSPEPQRIGKAGSSLVTGLTNVGNGVIAVSTYGSGLGIYLESSGKYREFSITTLPEEIKSNHINDIIKGLDGNLWISTDGAGLGKVVLGSDGAVTSVTYLGKDEGVPSNNIKSVCFSKNASIWASSSNGLCEIDSRNLKVLGVFLQDDRVLGRHFNTRAQLESKEGMMYFGTTEGVAVLNPSTFPNLFSGRSVMINNVAVGNLNSTITMTEKGKSVISSKVIKVRQKDAPVLSFSFSNMQYGNPNRVAYECTLKGPNFHNVLTTVSNPVQYLGLKPGRYVFTVRISGPSSNLGEDSKTVIVLARWYQSTVAKIVYILVFISFVLFCSAQIRKLKRKLAAKDRYSRRRGMPGMAQDGVIKIPTEARQEIIPVDPEFLETLKKRVEEHLLDPELTTSQVSELVSMSRKALIKKLAINTGLSINEFVRKCRMDKAGELLESGEHRINEVAYMVGYSSPSYFTKHFVQQYGVSPSEFLLRKMEGVDV